MASVCLPWDWREHNNKELTECTDETDVQTWFAADPTITGRAAGWNKHFLMNEGMICIQIVEMKKSGY